MNGIETPKVIIDKLDLIQEAVEDLRAFVKQCQRGALVHGQAPQARDERE